MSLENFFNPKSIAVIGATSDKNKVGYAFMSNLLQKNSGSENVANRKIYPVTLNEESVLGLPVFNSVLDIPDEIDLAIIAVRAQIVPKILTDCGQKNIKNVIVISSGFKETGFEGAELESQIGEIAKKYNIALLGPNCLGVISAKDDLNASFAGRKPLPGKIAFLSQSGALGTALVDWSFQEGVGFSKIVSLGNEAQLTETDFLEYLENDSDTSAILMYLETLNDGPRFMEVLSRVTTKKPVVIIKAGMGTHGNLAALSHTGALAPQSDVFIAACKQAGAVTVSSVRGFFNVVKVLSQTTQTATPIQRVIVLTNGGGPSVIAADLIDRSKSLSLVTLSNDTKEALREVLPPMAAIGNPIDVMGDALADRYEKSLQILSEAEDTDAILVILTPQMMTETKKTADVLLKFKDKINIFPVFIGGEFMEDGRKELIKSGLSCFDFPRDVVESLDYLAKNAPKNKSPLHRSKDFKRQDGEMMDFVCMKNLLSEYDIFISGKFLTKKEDLENTLQELGEGSYAMKAISKQAVHKTESGAVRLNIANLEEANRVWEEFWTTIPAVEGVLIQKMEKKGREVIIGMKKDNTFGSAIIFGLGGIFTEAIKDTTIRVAPFGKEEALKMMKDIKGIKILQDFRGEPPVNFEMLSQIIVNLSRLALEHPEIKEIDLNPVMATENSATIIDARVMI
ncbi:MAG: hypothetical protein GX627_00525 [Parcubacteria group bacterium]|nr:hypothetical protein [Parcubacteria group bacterium]